MLLLALYKIISYLHTYYFNNIHMDNMRQTQLRVFRVVFTLLSIIIQCTVGWYVIHNLLIDSASHSVREWFLGRSAIERLTHSIQSITLRDTIIPSLYNVFHLSSPSKSTSTSTSSLH